MTALACSYDTLYHCRRNDRDRENECDRGIQQISGRSLEQYCFDPQRHLIKHYKLVFDFSVALPCQPSRWTLFEQSDKLSASPARFCCCWWRSFKFVTPMSSAASIAFIDRCCPSADRPSPLMARVLPSRVDLADEKAPRNASRKSLEVWL